jgi:hypothetical protein
MVQLYGPDLYVLLYVDAVVQLIGSYLRCLLLADR